VADDENKDSPYERDEEVIHIPKSKGPRYQHDEEEKS
jgi:hypothetical protein